MEPFHTHPHTETKKVLDRLSRAIGHLEAIRTMVEAGRDCTEVLVQIAAVRSAVHNIGKIICKTILIDDSLSVVGSFNYDMRSVYLDTELMLVIDSPSFHDLLGREMAAAAADSLVIPPDADNFSMLSGEASVGKKIALILMGLLSPVIRRLL